MHKAVTFGEIRAIVSRIDRVSICMLETMAYENFRFISEVPHSYDGKYLYGFGLIESEFEGEDGWGHLPCLEIMLSEEPKEGEGP